MKIFPPVLVHRSDSCHVPNYLNEEKINCSKWPVFLLHPESQSFSQRNMNKRIVGHHFKLARYIYIYICI